MNNKKKGKFIPFAAFLRPTEDLLWQSPEHVATLTDTLKSLLPPMKLSTLLPTGLFLLVIAGIILLARGRISHAGAFVAALTAMVSLMFIWLRYTLRLARGREVIGLTIPDHAIYAVTSERLFYQHGDDIRAESLENITLVNTLSRSTVSFGAVFPMWEDLEDAEHVKSIIDEARQNHSNEEAQDMFEQAQDHIQKGQLSHV